MTIFISSILLLLAVLSVHGFSSMDTHFDGVPATLRYPEQRRTLHSHLPKFSKKGSSKGDVYKVEEEHVRVYEKKSDKQSKSSSKGGSKGSSKGSSKSSKKSSKKEKSGKYDYGSRVPTKAPYHAPSNDSSSGSHDSSEDCPRK